MANKNPESSNDDSAEKGVDIDWTRFIIAVIVAAAFVAIVIIFF